MRQWLSDLKWTPESVVQWQLFFNNASRILFTGRSGNFEYDTLPTLPYYKDLQPELCQKQEISNIANGLLSESEHTFISLFIIIPFLMLTNL